MIFYFFALIYKCVFRCMCVRISRIIEIFLGIKFLFKGCFEEFNFSIKSISLSVILRAIEPFFKILWFLSRI